MTNPQTDLNLDLKLERFKLLNALQPSQIADRIEELTPAERPIALTQLPPELAAQVFEFLPFQAQKLVIQALKPEQAARILKDMSPDDRTAFLEELPSASVNELLKLLPIEERVIALKLLGYPENSVGRLMTTDYLAVKQDWTVRQVFDYIRQYGQDSETLNVIYVVDDQGQLVDDMRIRELLFAPPEAKISNLIDGQCVTLSAQDNDEEAIKIFLRYDRTALPVIDAQGFLMGIVTIDDILNLVNQEDTEDIQMIGGTEALEEPYMQIPFMQLMKKRGSWLILLFLGEMLTATAMGYFEDKIAQAVVLALFVPLIISSGGNSGSQASTLIIRALAIGEVHLHDWWKIMRREVLSGLFLGSLLGIIGFMRIALWSTFTSFYGPYWMLLAFTLLFSLIGVVLWGTLMGSMLPLLLKRLGFDPAVSSAPFVATLVDVTGILIYFFFATLLMQGTLL